MVERFRHFLIENKLWRPGERMLLAVSGGVDSVVMAHLFQQAGIPAGIAHCNFQLRGEAADADALFVEDLARRLGSAFHQASFPTREIATRRGLSIQMAARELRYSWLEQVRREQGYYRIATAHHLNDTIETVMYNFAKGCGLRGLQGIPRIQGWVVRPLLFALRSEIKAYAEKEKLLFREDASNREDKYARNFIRHRIITRFRELNPAFDNTAVTNIQHLQGAMEVYDYALFQLKKRIVRTTGSRQIIDRAGLMGGPSPATVLFELLHPLGFHSAQIPQILESMQRQPGALFFSDTHQLVVDRETLIIDRRIIHQENQQFFLTPDQALALPGGRLELKTKTGRPPLFPADPWQAALDAGQLQYPLRLRRWQKGDVFCPLGMRGQRQKLQDFFTNQKVSRADKEQIWLLESGNGEICWILGYRIDERYKITDKTEQYLWLTFRKEAAV